MSPKTDYAPTKIRPAEAVEVADARPGMFLLIFAVGWVLAFTVWPWLVGVWVFQSISSRRGTSGD